MKQLDKEFVMGTVSSYHLPVKNNIAKILLRYKTTEGNSKNFNRI